MASQTHTHTHLYTEGIEDTVSYHVTLEQKTNKKE